MTIGRGLSIQALAIGVLVDYVGDIIGGIIVGIVFSSGGGSVADTGRDPAFLGPVIAGATLATVIAGWVAARVAKRHQALHGFLVGVLAVCLGRFLAHGKWTWFDIGSAIVTPLAGLIGGVIAARRRPRIDEPAA